MKAEFRNTDVVRSIEGCERSWGRVIAMLTQNINNPGSVDEADIDSATVDWRIERANLYRLLNIKDTF